MIVCRITHYAEGKDAERAACGEEHRRVLRAGIARVIDSGPLFSTDGSDRRIGALVVFDVDDIGDVERFNAADPYVTQGIYSKMEILRWQKVIG
jgi:uncharacterized protein